MTNYTSDLQLLFKIWGWSHHCIKSVISNQE